MARLKRDRDTETAWLGIEAIPGGLATINDTIQAGAEAIARKRSSSLLQNRPANLIVMAGRWMKKAAWFS